MTDPTPEQIEATPQADYHRGYQEGLLHAGLAVQASIDAGELVAAAGAAPQSDVDMSALIMEARTLAARKVEDSADAEALQIMVGLLCDQLAAPVQVDEAKLAEAIAEELETDDAIAEEWSSGKLGATARRLVQFAVLPVLRGGGR